MMRTGLVGTGCGFERDVVRKNMIFEQTVSTSVLPNVLNT